MGLLIWLAAILLVIWGVVTLVNGGIILGIILIVIGLVVGGYGSRSGSRL